MAKETFQAFWTLVVPGKGMYINPNLWRKKNNTTLGNH